MRRRWVLALACLAGIPSVASAGGELATPVASVVVEDGFDACATPVAGFCAFEADTTGDPGDWDVDAYQSFDYVGVAANGSLVGAPAHGATVDGSEVVVPHPVFRLATAAWDAHRHHAPLPPGYEATSSEDNVTLRYVGPSTKDPFHPMAPRTWTYEHMEGEGVGYDQAGPFLQPTAPGRASHSDTALEDVVLVCVLVPAPPCAEAAGAASRALLAATPDARLGVEFYDVEVASDPARLGRDAEEPRDAPSGAQARRARDAPPPPGARPAPRPGSDAPAASLAPGGSPSSGAGAPAPPEAPPGGGAAGVQARGAQRAPPLLAVAVAAAVAGALLASAALYTRLTRGALLRQATRRDIVRIVENAPGIRFADLVEAVDATRNAVRYHVRVLAREGVLRTFTVDGRACLAPAGWSPPPGARLSGLLLERHPVRRRLLDAMRAAPEGLTRAEVHDLLADVPRRSRNHTLRVLVDRGVLRERRDAEGTARLLLAGGQLRGQSA